MMYFDLELKNFLSDFKELAKNKNVNSERLIENMREIARICKNDGSFTVTLIESEQIHNERTIFAFVIEENEDGRNVIRYEGHN